MHIEMKRGEEVIRPRQHSGFIRHNIVGAFVGAAIVAILFSLT